MIAQCGGLMSCAVGCGQLVTEKDGKRKVRWWPNFRIVDTADYEPDAAVAKRVAHYQKQLSKELDVTIGKTATAVTISICWVSVAILTAICSGEGINRILTR